MRPGHFRPGFERQIEPTPIPPVTGLPAVEAPVEEVVPTLEQPVPVLQLVQVVPEPLPPPMAPSAQRQALAAAQARLRALQQQATAAREAGTEAATAAAQASAGAAELRLAAVLDPSPEAAESVKRNEATIAAGIAAETEARQQADDFSRAAAVVSDEVAGLSNSVVTHERNAILRLLNASARADERALIEIHDRWYLRMLSQGVPPGGPSRLLLSNARLALNLHGDATAPRVAKLRKALLKQVREEES